MCLTAIAGTIFAGETVWENQESETTAVLAAGGSSLIFKSAKYHYTLTMPYHMGKMECGFSPETPLSVNTARFALAMKIEPRGELTEAEYLHAVSKALQDNKDLLTRDESILQGPGRSVLRFLMRARSGTGSPGISPDWQWNYLTAVPSGNHRYILQIASMKKAKPDHEPHDSEILEILRDGLSVGVEDSGEPAPGGEPGQVRAAAQARPPEGPDNPACALPEWQGGPGVKPPVRIQAGYPHRPSGVAKGAWAELLVTIEPTGNVKEPILVCRASDRQWAFTVRKSSRGWRFQPGTRDGKPVEFKMRIKLAAD